MYEELIKKALHNVFGEVDVSLEIPENSDFGDYSTNVAMKAKSLKLKVGDMVKKLQTDKELLKITERVEVAGPGFINFWLKKEALLDNLALIRQEKVRYGELEIGKGKKVVVEYSSPNIARRFGIGHLRSTIIGQAIYNLYRSIGYETIGVNHLGDWGTQFGTILADLKIRGLDPKNLTVVDLERMYVDFNTKSKQKPELRDEAKRWFKKLEDGDKEARLMWEEVRKISLDEFERIYKRLDIKIDHAHGESFYEDKMATIVKTLREMELSEKSEGAEIIKLEGITPAMLVKSDGASTYFTRDLAALRYRIDTYHPDYVIYEVGSDQILHFRQVFEAASLLGWVKNLKLVHIPHGLVRFKGGKMSTRRGTTIKLEDVLDEAVRRASKFNKDKTISEVVGIGAVKYFDLMHHPTSDIIFDWNKIFVLEGNSGPYLQYTYARTQSVLHKTSSLRGLGSSYSSLSENGKNLALIDQGLAFEEESVLRQLIHFHTVLKNAAFSYSPNLLCNYLFNLAQRYNTFYNKHKIIGSDNEEFRIMLTFGVGQVLENGLKILGIQAPEAM